MTESVWNVSGYDRDDAVRLCRSGINPLVAVLMASRGICDGEEIENLLRDDCSGITSPFLMKGMDAAADRVRRAIADGESVVVYGDYDVDGITSSCLVADYLRSRGLECGIYIPERLESGYGVRSSALDAIKDGGASLVITVDCGITAAEEARHAEEIGLDMVVTDHHEVSGPVPDTVVVDPKQPDCPSPTKTLAGVGVAFKLICAVDGEENTEKLLGEYSDLVALGTIADVMPVTGENRIYIRRGLEKIRRGDRPGISELCSAAGTEESRISVTGVGYTLAPRINAAGRLGAADTAVELLTTDDSACAAQRAEELCAMNRERQRIEAEMLKDALEMLKETPPDGKPIVLASDEWHQGVAGIVASRLTEKFGLPSVMICLKNGVGRGSCRSVGGFNIFEALEKCRDELIGFGGHDMAAGLTIEAGAVDSFRRKLRECFEERREEVPEQSLRVDFEVVKPEILTVYNIDALGVLEPYGTGNPQPVLCLRDTEVERLVPLSEGKHTKMWVRKGDESFEAVFFGKSIGDLGAKENGAADIAFVPQVNEYRGRRSVQLYLVDIIAH